MKAIGLLFVIEAVAIKNLPSTSSFKDEDYHEKPDSTIHILDTTTKPWWHGLGLNITKTTRTTVKTTTEFNPVANMSLSPQEVIDLIGDLDNLNATVVGQTIKVFGENKPELNELVFKWLFELVEKAELTNDTTFATVTSAEVTENTIDIRKLTTKFTDDMLWREEEFFVTDPIEAENIHRQGTNSGIKTEDNFQGIPPKFDPNDPLGFKLKKIPPSFQGHEGLTAGRYEGTPPSDSLSPTYPPGNSPRIPPELQNQYKQIHNQEQRFQNKPTYQSNQGVSEISQYNTAMVHTTSSYLQAPTAGLITQETPQRLDGNASPNVPPVELVTAGSTVLAPAGRQDYANLLDPDHDPDMFAHYGQGPPSMADEAGNLLFAGLGTTPTTTTIHPIVQRIKLKMVETRNGYFSSFITKLFELVAIKEKHAAARLFAATDLEVNDLERDGTLHEFGLPFLPATLKLTQLMVGAAPEIVQSQASIAHQMMKNRQAFLVPKLNTIIDGIDSLYLIEEGDMLLLSLVDVAEYPENNLTSRAVVRTVIHRLLAPYRRLAGTDRLRVVIIKINDEINNRLPGRREALRGMTYVRRDNVQRNTAKSDRNDIKTSRNTNVENIKGKIDMREGRHRNMEGRYIDRINLTKYTYDRKRSKNSFLNVKNNRDTYIPYKKRKPIEIDLKKQIKNIHADFKNESREDYNLHHRYNNMKKLKTHRSTINDRNGHSYIKQSKKSFVGNSRLGKNTFDGEKGRLKQTKYNVKERFEVVNKYKLPRNREIYIKNKTNTDSAARENQEKKDQMSKYLARLSFGTRKKSRIESNKLMSDLFSIKSKNDAEEIDLKFRLQDAMIHGNRKFIERRNLKPANKKKLYDISDYSDKDVVLKSQIYKEFYKKSAQSNK